MTSIAPLRAQDFVPQVVGRTIGQGAFALTPATAVVFDDASKPVAEYLTQTLGLSRAAILPSRPDARSAGSAVSGGAPSGAAATGAPQTTIRLRVDPKLNLPAEGYRIEIAKDLADLAGKDYGGVFYAVQTLLQMLPPDVYRPGSAWWSGTKGAVTYGVPDATYRDALGLSTNSTFGIPCQTIEDYPAYPYRGVLLDVSRTFMSVEEVERYIDNMARHKLNVLHWHLTDDEGWRIEIKACPQLTDVGAWRGGDSPVWPVYGKWDEKYGGYYTQEQIREVVEYARRRAVEIIPEIDLPGHSRATGKALPQILCSGKPDTSLSAGYDRRNVWCVGNEDNYKILKTIISEVAGLFPSRYIHVGDDEVSKLGSWGWKTCPHCLALMKRNHYRTPHQMEQYFIRRMSEIVRSCGKQVCAWDEAAEPGGADKAVQISAWRDSAHVKEVLARGYTTVVMPAQYFYIDMKQAPDEAGVNWAWLVDARRLYSFSLGDLKLTAEQAARVRGYEAALWGEAILPQPPYYRDYMSWPRLCAMAEVGWRGEQRAPWDDFYARLLSSHLARLAAMGIRYRPFPQLADKASQSPSLPGGSALPPPPRSGGSVRGGDSVQTPLLSDGAQTPSPRIWETIFDPTSGDYPWLPADRSGVACPEALIAVEVGADSAATIPVDLCDYMGDSGIWMVRVSSPLDNMTLCGIGVQAPDTTLSILSKETKFNPMTAYRLPASPRVARGTLNIAVRNDNARPAAVTVSLRRSPYIEPPVTLTSSMRQLSRAPFGMATDFNFNTVAFTYGTCRRGDWFLFTFADPVDASFIGVGTGYAQLQRCIIPRGWVETSADGSSFVRAGELRDGSCTVRPAGAVKAVKVVADCDGNGESAVIIRDLKILPK